MKIKLSDIASIAEIIGAIAIVISLIFVGVQLQGNTRATLSASAIAASTATAQWYTTLGSSERNSTLFRDFVSNPDSLTPDKRFQAIINLHGVILIFQNNFYLAKEGTLDPGIKDSITEAIVIIKDRPGWEMYWKQRRSIFLDEFQSYVDELMLSEVHHDADSIYGISE